MKKTSRPHSCNVLSLGDERQELWQFATGTQKISATAEHGGLATDALPKQTIAKDWRTFVQPKLNVAWLPAEQVFLRVLHLPAADDAELRSMVEFQLEKLSPLPIAQIVWSTELLPKTAENLQPVIVIIVARSVVEEFLGKLESKGYLADRLELPFLHQLLATQISGDGVWLYPRASGSQFFCLAAWWYGGVLRELVLQHLPRTEEAGAILAGQVNNMAWSGELEGWLTSAAVLHVVADEATAEEFRRLAGLDAGVETITPLAGKDLAEAAARRAASGTGVNLMPEEFGVRYKGQLVDRLWMGGLGALAVIYIVGVVLYFGWLQVIQFQRGRVETQLAELSGSYTNALQLKAKVQVLQEQFSLKFAALDAWKVTAQLLPDDLRLTSFSVSKGKSVSFFGDTTVESVPKVTEYNRAVVNASLDTNGGVFFSTVKPPQIQTRNAQGVNQATWSFSAEIKRTEVE